MISCGQYVKHVIAGQDKLQLNNIYMYTIYKYNSKLIIRVIFASNDRDKI